MLQWNLKVSVTKNQQMLPEMAFLCSWTLAGRSKAMTTRSPLDLEGSLSKFGTLSFFLKDSGKQNEEEYELDYIRFF